MPETLQQQDLLSLAQKNVLAYLQTHDVKYLTENAVFHNLTTGEKYTGRAEVGAMLHFMYHIAFDAHLQLTEYMVTEDKASAEGLFIGKHIGEINGIPATGRDISVPICINYKLKEGLIEEGRIYMLTDVLTSQLGVSQNAAAPKVTFIVRDIFQLKFGHFRDAKELLTEALKQQMMPEASVRVLTDFTGESYRLIFEEGFDNLADYEVSLSSSMKTADWQSWYERFKPHVERSYREILKQVF